MRPHLHQRIPRLDHHQVCLLLRTAVPDRSHGVRIQPPRARQFLRIPAIVLPFAGINLRDLPRLCHQRFRPRLLDQPADPTRVRSRLQHHPRARRQRLQPRLQGGWRGLQLPPLDPFRFFLQYTVVADLFPHNKPHRQPDARHLPSPPPQIARVLRGFHAHFISSVLLRFVILFHSRSPYLFMAPYECVDHR